MGFKFRPVRIGSEGVYRNSKLKRFFELVNDAWVQYGMKVFGGITEENPMVISSVATWKKAVKEQET